MRLGVVAAVAMEVVLAACSSSTAPSTAAPVAQVSRCTTIQLEMRLVFVGFGAGNAEGIVDVRNRSGLDCDLAGYASVQLLGDGATPLPTKAYDTTTSFFNPDPLPAVVVTLDAGSDPISFDGPVAGHAYIEITWSDGSLPCEQPVSFAITPPQARVSIVISAIPSTPGAPTPFVCGGGVVGILPIQAAQTVGPFGARAAASD